ncbi:hypothetical protein SLS53_000732 [Cytospora paraplurivora]|uniref:Cation efflux protein transmembrane domain-containing protein n=1 Tax=Cytospora paraplurivora TaxID=2898453 RepID=A0AAN9UIK7_9PEZI
MVGRRMLSGDGSSRSRKDANPYRPRPAALRFQDASNKALEDERRNQLKHKLINSVKADHLERYRKSEDEIKELKNKGVQKFYKAQNEALNDWLEIDSVVRYVADDIFESFDPDRDHDGILEHGGTLQAQGEDIEAFLPEIWTTSRLVGWRLSALQKRFPVGRRRLEPLGILVFSIIMVISFGQILQESIGKLVPSGVHETVDLGTLAIAAMAATIAVKGTIWFGCIRVKTTQVQALAQDCKTDVYFNTLSLLFPLIGKALDVWWLDPLGAAILSVFIIWDWAGTAFENVSRLSGSLVDDRLFRKVTFLMWRFSPIVEGFKSIKAYHAGDGVWVEVDILLDPYTPLMKSHDIAETLQYCLEGLPEVDRAFVTTDYTYSGPSGHSSAIN